MFQPNSHRVARRGRTSRTAALSLSIGSRKFRNHLISSLKQVKTVSEKSPSTQIGVVLWGCDVKEKRLARREVRRGLIWQDMCEREQ